MRQPLKVKDDVVISESENVLHFIVDDINHAVSEVRKYFGSSGRVVSVKKIFKKGIRVPFAKPQWEVVAENAEHPSLYKDKETLDLDNDSNISIENQDSKIFELLKKLSFSDEFTLAFKKYISHFRNSTLREECECLASYLSENLKQKVIREELKSLAFVGPSGVGKTTALLNSSCLLKGCAVGVSSVLNVNSVSRYQLENSCRLTNEDLMEVNLGDTFAFFDTGSIEILDFDRASALLGEIRRKEKLDLVLVVNSLYDPLFRKKIYESLKALEVEYIYYSHFDEYANLSPLLEEMLKNDFRVLGVGSRDRAYLSTDENFVTFLMEKLLPREILW